MWTLHSCPYCLSNGPLVYILRRHAFCVPYRLLSVSSSQVLASTFYDFLDCLSLPQSHPDPAFSHSIEARITHISSTYTSPTHCILIDFTFLASFAHVRYGFLHDQIYCLIRHHSGFNPIFIGCSCRLSEAECSRRPEAQRPIQPT